MPGVLVYEDTTAGTSKSTYTYILIPGVVCLDHKEGIRSLATACEGEPGSRLTVRPEAAPG